MHWLIKSFENEKENSHKYLIYTLTGIVYLCTVLIFQDGKEFASNNGLMFTEVSAKTGMNVDEVFTNLGQYIHIIVQYPQTILIHSAVQFNRQNNTYLQVHTHSTNLAICANGSTMHIYQKVQK